VQVIIGKHIKDILRQQNVDNPDAVLQQCTYQRPPQIEKIKAGGRQRSLSTEGRVQKKPKSPPSARKKVDRPKVKVSSSPGPIHKSKERMEKVEESESESGSAGSGSEKE